LTPVRIGVTVVGVNFVLNLTLIWPMAEAGLAVATAIGASFQVVTLAVLFSRRNVPLKWRRLVGTILRTLIATLTMSVACYGATRLLPVATGFGADLLDVLVPFAAGVATYLAMSWWLGAPELRLLSTRSTSGP
jgi:peptidoglycan biosynthesis protein MviN/MurJ (putative lipid II flippase)